MALMYCFGLLDKFARPYAGAIGPEFILVNNDAHPHPHLY